MLLVAEPLADQAREHCSDELEGVVAGIEEIGAFDPVAMEVLVGHPVMRAGSAPFEHAHTDSMELVSATSQTCSPRECWTTSRKKPSCSNC